MRGPEKSLIYYVDVAKTNVLICEAQSLRMQPDKVRQFKVHA